MKYKYKYEDRKRCTISKNTQVNLPFDVNEIFEDRNTINYSDAIIHEINEDSNHLNDAHKFNTLTYKEQYKKDS